ncbi:hypothetical protein DSO57_1009601 [Entomophthora muscae]|uniref:Uncharacterized protein n=2 Tax=Entomophthora muscae TaxID=34485 RepID=A0ACC2SJN0_9FUNG|nr:hypothetical protein DSO57_1009601 [Entomophthora muscae]
MDLPDHSQPRPFLGLSILGFCLLAFVIQTEVTQYLQKNLDFKSPYFILWFSHSFYMLVFPLDMISRKVLGKSSFKRSYESLQEQIEGLEREGLGESHDLQGNLFYFGRIVFVISLALTSGAYLWYIAVGLTSMSSLTAIYNTSCFFAYLFSVYGGLESFNRMKALSVILSIIGVVIITAFGESTGQQASFVGNLFGAISAVLIGLFEVIYKKFAVSSKSPTSLMANFVTSYIGMVTFGLFWLPLPFLHLTGLEPFSFPVGSSLTLLMVNALMGVLYNAGLMLLISVTSPVFASVGVMTTIPVIAVVDSIFLKKSLTSNVLLGGAVIALGFLVLTRETLAEHSTKTRLLRDQTDLPEDEATMPDNSHGYSQVLPQDDSPESTHVGYS